MWLHAPVSEILPRLTGATLLLLLAAPGRAAERPDLSGVWDFRTLIPLERPKDLGDKAVLTPEEAAERRARADERVREAAQPSDADREAPPKGENVGSYNNFWFDPGSEVEGDRRTSLLVDPPNGRLPERVAGVETQVIDGEMPAHGVVRIRVGGLGADGPEDRGLSERCLQGFNAGPPILPGGYNQNILVVQTEDHVVLLNEMNHDARIIRMNAEHGPPEIRSWLGDSVGRWEGEELVIETAHFTPKLASFSPSAFSAIGSAEHMRLVERLRLEDDATLRYEFTVDDPTTFTRPFTGVLLMKRSAERLYEYACHEGNYAMQHMLSAARFEERAAAESSDR